jgi:hypothetical protein
MRAPQHKAPQHKGALAQRVQLLVDKRAALIARCARARLTHILLACVLPAQRIASEVARWRHAREERSEIARGAKRREPLDTLLPADL